MWVDEKEEHVAVAELQTGRNDHRAAAVRAEGQKICPYSALLPLLCVTQKEEEEEESKEDKDMKWLGVTRKGGVRLGKKESKRIHETRMTVRNKTDETREGRRELNSKRI